MTGRTVIGFPRPAPGESYDPNLSRRFTGEEVRGVWKKIDALVMEEVRELVLKHEPNLELELTPGELELRVAHIAGFFLRESAKRVDLVAYSKWREEKET